MGRLPPSAGAREPSFERWADTTEAHPRTAAAAADATQGDYTLADERYVGTVNVSLFHPKDGSATLTQRDVLRLFDAIVTR